MEAIDRSTPRSSPQADAVDDNNRYMVNRALTLESAVQLALLVAAHHVDTSTRNLKHIDVTSLLERGLAVQSSRLLAKFYHEVDHVWTGSAKARPGEKFKIHGHGICKQIK
jgi:hypothetical protein